MLKASEREKLQDCLLLIQSARSILSGFYDTKSFEFEDLERCFQEADQTLSRLLRA